jgi:hypothetical protein
MKKNNKESQIAEKHLRWKWITTTTKGKTHHDIADQIRSPSIVFAKG